MVAAIGKRGILGRALRATGCNRLLPLWRGLLVLNYHRIGSPDGSYFDRGLWSASAEGFDRQVRFLSQHFDLIGLDDLDQVLRGARSRSGRYVMITFDDGYRDNYELAFPTLRSYGAKAAFFVTSGFLDRRDVAWWDEIAWMARSSVKDGIPANVWTIQPVAFDPPHRQQAIHRLLATFKHLDGHETDAYLDFLAEATGSGRCPRRLADELWMTWDMVREMRSAGMSFGAHTVNHPVLSRLPAEEQELEIFESSLRIAWELGEEIVAFSFPIGQPDSFNDVTRACLSRLGFRWAFSYYGGYGKPGTIDRFDIPRFAVERDVTDVQLRWVAALPQVFA